MSDLDDQDDAQRIASLLHEHRVVLDSAMVGIIKVQHRHIIWANRAFESLMGFEPGECLGTPTRQYYRSQEEFDAIGAQAYALL